MALRREPDRLGRLGLLRVGVGIEASIGLASEITRIAGDAASICATRVEPQREVWKTNPLGGSGVSSATHSASASRPVSRRKTSANGRCRQRSIVWSKNGSTNAASPV